MGSAFRFNGKVALIVVLILIFTAILSMPIVSAKPSRAEFLLRFKPGICRREDEALLRSLGACTVDEIPQIHVLVISVPEETDRVKSALMRKQI
ncbi:MAG: hypothetical protein QW424_05945 [Candidatus Bathyarchaeia archaeon]|nr:hypothetical protein [Candidatus Bathyarchaeota archaeon]